MENIVWKFSVRGRDVEVISSTKKMDALLELGRAIGVGGITRGSILNEIYKLKPRMIARKLLDEKGEKK